jgi:hypothetical protein
MNINWINGLLDEWIDETFRHHSNAPAYQPNNPFIHPSIHPFLP